MKARKLARILSYALWAHDTRATEAKKRIRKFDGYTPYGAHPCWCALMILAEPALPRELREYGAEVLAFHDVLEDATSDLPERTSNEVRLGVEEMTFESFAEETILVWNRSKVTRLFKLFDKVSNLLDGTWMTPEKRAAYCAYTLLLADDVEQNHGMLNIVRIARAIAV